MLPVAVTMGEPGGVGGELVLAAWRRLRHGRTPFLVIDDPARLRALADAPGEIRAVAAPEAAAAVFPSALPVLPEPLTVPAPAGQPSPGNAAAVLRSICRAVALVREGRAGALVTSPVDKQALHAGAGFGHAGHTGFLGELAGCADPPVMMLVSGSLRVVPVTGHVPLRAVPELLAGPEIVRTGRIVAETLRQRLGIAAPRLAVAGLNPHAGEGGLLGREDAEIVRPAVASLRRDGIDASGPHAADSLFRPAFRRRFDAALCMYHDQALIPLKAVGFRRAVNVTLGLPFLRTSPGHGVAYDLAGSFRADPDSLIAAIRFAGRRSPAWRRA